MVIKTEAVETIKTENNEFADSYKDLVASQEKVNIVKSLISKNEKLEADVVAKDANLEQLSRVIVEMENSIESLATEKWSLQNRLDHQITETDAIIQRFEQENLRGNFSLKKISELKIDCFGHFWINAILNLLQ